MQHIEAARERDDRVRSLLAFAEQSAESAIRIMRASLASAPAGGFGALLDDVDRLFALIDAADLRAELARVSPDHDDAVEHAEDACSLAHAADAEARRRARRHW